MFQVAAKKTVPSIKKPPKGFIERISEGEEFNYTTFEQNPNWIRSILNWFAELFNGNMPLEAGVTILKFLLFSIFIGTLIYVIAKAARGELGQLLRGSKKLGPENVSIDGEDVYELDLEQLIADNVAKGNFRLAIRYTYLSLLKQLADREFIDWKKDKTNREYGAELSVKAPSMVENYSSVTRHFEYLWYGQTEMNRDVFASNQELFQQFRDQISSFEERA